MIFTSLSPNAERDDVLLALKLRLSAARRKAAAGSRTLLQEKFSAYLSLPAGQVFAFESGRTSLFSALSALELSPSAEVLLQSYTCVAVPGPVLWAGTKPVYVDCLDDLTMDPADLEKKITPDSKVLIIQHTFGMPAKIGELIAIARKHGLFVIEDCAHSLGAEYQGRKTGTFGDASFFSFGRDKAISSVFGGMLAVRDAKIAEKVRALHESFPASPLPWVKRQLNHPVIFAVGKATYSFLHIGKIKIEISKRLGLFSKAVETAELSGGKPGFAFHKMSDVLALLALHQFEKLERFNAHRKKLAAIYDSVIAATWVGIASRGIDPQRKSIFLRYAIFVPDPLHLAAYMKSHGILLGDWYSTGIAPKGVAYGKIGYDPATCPKAEAFALRSANLPTSIGVSEKDARRIADLLSYYISNGSKIH
jgi:perosamine synthetase